MGSLTARGRVAVVVAFVASAALASGAAVALVQVSDDDRTPGTSLPRVAPTLISPSDSPTPAPSVAPVVTAAPSQSPAPAPASPAASATASPKPAGTTSPRPATGTTQKATYLSAKALLDPVSDSAFRLVVRATDGDDLVRLASVKWGDGTSTGATSGAACSAPAGGDCRVFTLDHAYAQGADATTYTITVLVTAGKEKVVLTLQASVSAATASPAPTAAA